MLTKALFYEPIPAPTKPMSSEQTKVKAGSSAQMSIVEMQLTEVITQYSTRWKEPGCGIERK
jgi:hypothetical protein